MTEETRHSIANVSRETRERLEIYADLLSKWTRKINLIAPSSLPQLWSRHIADSTQLFEFVRPTGGNWVDMGSGGGLPGLVIAIMAAEAVKDLKVTLIESDQRKATFLRTVSRETEVPVRVISERIEAVSPLGADYLSARALASLDILLGFADRHLAHDGLAVFPKGARHEEELRLAQENWSFDYQTRPSSTDPNAAIYLIKGVRRV